MKRLTLFIGVSLFFFPFTQAAESRALRCNAASPAEVRAWQQTTRRKLIELMMGGAEPARGPLDPRLIRRVEKPAVGYALEELTLQTLPDRRVHVWLARPLQTSRRVGAVLALHGHGGTAAEVVHGLSLYWYGRALAELGYVVIAPDIGQHELQHPAWSLMGERAWDALRCVDYLVSLPEVDSTRLGVVGLSLGGETAMYVAALDERLELACSSGWLTTVANMKNGHCPCFNFPGLEEHFDFADIFACVAPRALVCELGEQERAPGGFPISIGQQAFSEIAPVYRILNAESNLVLTIHPAGHVFDGRDFWAQVPVLRSFGAERQEDGAMTEAAAYYQQCELKSRQASEGLNRCRRYVDGWLAQADPATGLIPRNLTVSKDFWNGRDAAADNYPFMVLTAALTDQALLNGRMLEMLRTETRLTCRLDRLPDDYSFSKQGWRRERLVLDEVIFDSAEYVKDGLLCVAEWLGTSPWTERMTGIVNDIWKNAAIDTPFGRLATLNLEVNGDLLQACSRSYWLTRDRKYLDWAIRLGDYYLLGTNQPARDAKELRLIDHGCEILNGLSELYFAVSSAAPEKKKAYEAPIHALFDRVLELGRNEDGLLYTAIYPQTETHSAALSDTWGYVYDGFYTLYLLDGTVAYRDAVRKVLGRLKDKYVGAPWADRSADGYADSIEGALNLYNREPIASAAEWIDSQTRSMWDIQKSDGTIEGWHGDGNFARTTLMYVLWKTQGARLQPWRTDVRVGAVLKGRELLVYMAADEPWSGQLVFDTQRHRRTMRMPEDYPRINQFPEWFTVEPERHYRIHDQDGRVVREASFEQMCHGLSVELKPGAPVFWRVTGVNGGKTGD